MKVIKLVSENIKGLKAVEFEPDENLQIISGKNGQGKSSVMDSIWLALGGSNAIKSTSTTKAIRDGEERAYVTLDLGDIVVTRKWTSNDRSSLKVESKDGTGFSSPQSLLNELIGKMSFDPLAFNNLTGKEQVELLLSSVELEKNPNDIDKAKKEIFDERTLVNREVRALKNKIDLSKVPADVPEEKIPLEDLFKEIQDANEHNQKESRLLSNLSNLEFFKKQQLSQIEFDEEEIERLKAKIKEIEEKVVKGKEQAKSTDQQIIEAKEELEKFEKIDVSILNEKLRTHGEMNEKFNEYEEYKKLVKKYDEKKLESDSLTEKIKALEEEKCEIFRNADLPISGLTFEDEEVFFNGIPLKQCSTAERLKVSMSIAMSLNPELRIIRIMDGSLLDSSNLELIRQMAVDKDYQVWVEQVDESGKVGIVIEDGEVVANNQLNHKVSQDSDDENQEYQASDFLSLREDIKVANDTECEKIKEVELPKENPLSLVF